MEKRIDLKKTCPENWEKMKVGLHSRFCDNCNKNVIDFSKMNKREIQEYLLKSSADRVCGRISRSQLDYSNTDLLLTIPALSSQSKSSNAPFYLLAAGTMILISCNSNQPNQPQIPKKDISTIQVDTADKVVNINLEPLDTIRTKVKTEPAPPLDPDEFLLGEIELHPNKVIAKSELYTVVDEMPEFKGGMDSLFSYVKQNLKYPEWERKNKIQGKVFVNFIIKKDGKIKEPKILRSVSGSRNFDAEVLRVIDQMPDWTAGKHEGEYVDVQLSLPIYFKL